eukprot:2154931-Rhodomonas_salina.1
MALACFFQILKHSVEQAAFGCPVFGHTSFNAKFVHSSLMQGRFSSSGARLRTFSVGGADFGAGLPNIH